MTLPPVGGVGAGAAAGGVAGPCPKRRRSMKSLRLSVRADSLSVAAVEGGLMSAVAFGSAVGDTGSTASRADGWAGGAPTFGCISVGSDSVGVKDMAAAPALGHPRDR